MTKRIQSTGQIIAAGKTEVRKKKSGPVPLCPPQSPHVLSMTNTPDIIIQLSSTQKWINLIYSTNVYMLLKKMSTVTSCVTSFHPTGF
jgi:hypothetical protein